MIDLHSLKVGQCIREYYSVLSLILGKKRLFNLRSNQNERSYLNGVPDVFVEAGCLLDTANTEM